SDGSRRLIDLLPAFCDVCDVDRSRVYFIDEIDRSLHTLLTRRLVELFLSSCDHECRNQLFFTTHDVLLMDQDMFRKDEMWVTEKSTEGASALYSFSEFSDIRNDKDIRKSYLQGRMGGIPKLLVGSCLADNSSGESS